MEIQKIKFRQKKGFLLRDFVVVGIIFGIVIALFIIQVASIADNYHNTDIISPAFAAHYSKLKSDIIPSLDNTNKAVQGTGGLNLIGTFNVAFNSVFTAITMVWDSVLIYAGMKDNLASDFSFLDNSTILMFTGGLIAILTTYLIFIWLSSVSRGKI